MHKIRRFYYQNKEKIWGIVFLIGFILGIIYFLNANVGKNENKQNPLLANNNINYENTETNTFISDKSPISGETVTEKEVEQINNIITKFFEHCKNGQIEEAYNMLSSDCKESEYKTIEKFKEKYINSKFNKNDIYEIEKWIADTYKIRVKTDILSTGNINDKEGRTEYITIVDEGEEEKININYFIEKELLNKEKTENNVSVTAISKKTYVDYEIYDFKIENKTNNKIKLDAFEKTGTIYVEDANGKKYSAYNNEIIENELIILPGRNLQISIKFSNNYTSKRHIEKIVFSNLVLDYNKYQKEPQNYELQELIIDL